MSPNPYIPSTIAPMQVPLATVISEDAFTFLFRPGSPLQKIPHSQLLAKLISTDLVKVSKALLDADLAWIADKVALVHNDPTALLNGWYRKTGASGVGGWVQFETLATATRAAAEAAAATAAVSAAAAAAIGRYYATRAAGVAATAVGEMFTSDEGGTLAIYSRIAGAPNYLFYSNVPTAAALALKASLADLAAVTGAAMIGRDAGTVETALDALELASGTPFEPDVLPVQVLVPQSRGQREVLREVHRRPDRTVIDALLPVAVGERRNLWGQSEALASTHFTADSATKQVATVVIDGITLTRLTCNNFYSSLRSQASGLGFTPFTVGQRYLVSCFVLEVSAASVIANANDDDKFVWMRSLATGGSQAHGPKLIGNRMRRIWCLGHATTTAFLDLGPSATVALGGGANSDPYWLFSAQGGADNREIYIGGFQFEHVGDGTYKDGIAGIGDSTMQGSASTIDAYNSREWMGYLAAFLNVPTFNRAIGGNRLDTMDARWATDITPLAATCADVIIQGGINDIVQGRTLAQMQTSMNSMVAKAVADGLRPIIMTATPTTSIAAVPAWETLRTDFNNWIKRTFAHVLDAAAVIEDPYVPSKIRVDSGWTGDGVHYVQSAKRALGAFCAQWPHWNKREPGPYQPNSANANVWAPPVSVLRGAAGQLIGQRETGWAADTGTAKKTTNATYAPGVLLGYGAAYVEAEQDAGATRIQTIENALRDLSQETKSLKDALITHGLIGA